VGVTGGIVPINDKIDFPLFSIGDLEDVRAASRLCLAIVPAGKKEKFLGRRGCTVSDSAGAANEFSLSNAHDSIAKCSTRQPRRTARKGKRLMAKDNKERDRRGVGDSERLSLNE
jgi:hypothetical protein